MKRRAVQSVSVAVLACVLAGCAGGGKVGAARIDTSIQRGVDYLISSQNPDGSWGSARLTKALNIYAPVPGAHQGFRAATTSLCISALLETRPQDPTVGAVVDRAEEYLFSNLSRVRRGELDAVYNVWAHAYSIQALARMLDRRGTAGDALRRRRILDLMRMQVDMLRRYEFLGGGWGYYEFEAYHFDQPAGDPNSFTTATVLIALHRARAAGVEVPRKLIDTGLHELLRQRNPNFTYQYSRNWWRRPMGDINRPGGSLGRSQAGNAALRIWGDQSVTDEVLRQWLDRLFARQGWLDIGRKRPIPHESWFHVAAYFYYYGHYYGSMCIEMLPPEQRPRYRYLMARTIMSHQEEDGSWFDFPFYAYHKPYGTAYALMILQRAKGQANMELAEQRFGS